MITPDGEADHPGVGGHQSGLVGDRLDEARTRWPRAPAVRTGWPTGRPASTTGQSALADGADQAVTGARRIARTPAPAPRAAWTSSSTAPTTARSPAPATSYRRRCVVDGLTTAADQVRLAVDSLGLVYDALATKSLTCGLDPACRQARAGLKRCGRPGATSSCRVCAGAAAGTGSPRATSTGDLRTGLTQLRAGLAQARTGNKQLSSGQRTFPRAPAGPASPAGPTGSPRAPAGGCAAAPSRSPRRRPSSRTGSRPPYATSGPRAGTRTPPPGGLPAADGAVEPVLRHREPALRLRDGRTARIAVLGSTDAFGPEASARSQEVRDLVAASFTDTRLADAEVSVTSMAATNDDRRYPSPTSR